MGSYWYAFQFVGNCFDRYRNNFVCYFCFNFSFIFDFNHIVATGIDYNTGDNHGTKVAWY